MPDTPQNQNSGTAAGENRIDGGTTARLQNGPPRNEDCSEESIGYSSQRYINNPLFSPSTPTDQTSGHHGSSSNDDGNTTSASSPDLEMASLYEIVNTNTPIGEKHVQEYAQKMNEEMTAGQVVFLDGWEGPHLYTKHQDVRRDGMDYLVMVGCLDGLWLCVLACFNGSDCFFFYVDPANRRSKPNRIGEFLQNWFHVDDYGLVFEHDKNITVPEKAKAPNDGVFVSALLVSFLKRPPDVLEFMTEHSSFAGWDIDLNWYREVISCVLLHQHRGKVANALINNICFGVHKAFNEHFRELQAGFRMTQNAILDDQEAIERMLHNKILEIYQEHAAMASSLDKKNWQLKHGYDTFNNASINCMPVGSMPNDANPTLRPTELRSPILFPSPSNPPMAAPRQATMPAPLSSSQKRVTLTDSRPEGAELAHKRPRVLAYITDCNESSTAWLTMRTPPNVSTTDASPVNGSGNGMEHWKYSSSRRSVSHNTGMSHVDETLRRSESGATSYQRHAHRLQYQGAPNINAGAAYGGRKNTHIDVGWEERWDAYSGPTWMGLPSSVVAQYFRQGGPENGRRI